MYDIVSQNTLLFSVETEEEAIEYCEKQNEEYYKYVQECYDNNELPADNEVFYFKSCTF